MIITIIYKIIIIYEWNYLHIVVNLSRHLSMSLEGHSKVNQSMNLTSMMLLDWNHYQYSLKQLNFIYNKLLKQQNKSIYIYIYRRNIIMLFLEAEATFKTRSKSYLTFSFFFFFPLMQSASSPVHPVFPRRAAFRRKKKENKANSI